MKTYKLSIHLLAFLLFGGNVVWSQDTLKVRMTPPIDTSDKITVLKDSASVVKDTATVFIDSLEQTSEEVFDSSFIELVLEGKVYNAMVTEEGDTLVLANIDDISITSFREFESDEEYRKYQKFRRYANKVFPYAKEGIRIFREVEYAKANLKKRAYKKKITQLEKELKTEFEEPLKKLTKLQGKIMMKMIEKELDASMYTLLRGIKGRFAAFYWNQFGKLYSYDLKEGYQEGKYKVLDAVLQDFDVSYRIENNSNLKYISLDDIREKSKKK